ncbi:MAG TPA: type I 3-dehydroquinate dehydratase, partial [Acidobacteriota bacterium]|nr:type I 3-dehydroquinate dehydratase [Acidobacteriota bacterium]
ASFLATCRPVREGGHFAGPEEERLRLLKQASQAGFDWIDLEHDVEHPPAFAEGTRIVRSFHSFGRFPTSIGALFSRLWRSQPEVVKIAVPVTTSQELVQLLKWMEDPAYSRRRVLIGMGLMGQASRILGALLGNTWTYVAENENQAAAPGQFSLARAQHQYRLDKWETVPDLYGVIGNPVAHSLSPLIMNRLFSNYQVQALYLPLLLDQTAPWFQYMKESRLCFRGFSVTIPFKRNVISFLESSDTTLDSINTLLWTGSGWKGFNTDYEGFLRPLKQRYNLSSKSALVLGNGGVAHTVVAALQEHGVAVTVVGRDPQRVSQFARQYGCAWATFGDLPIRADLCVNTTPVGQAPDVKSSPLQKDHLDFELVYDLVYNPEITSLLQMAQEKGIGTLSGIEMFVEQAALQFQIWTGIDPERSIIRQVLREVQNRSGQPKSRVQEEIEQETDR